MGPLLNQPRDAAGRHQLGAGVSLLRPKVETVEELPCPPVEAIEEAIAAKIEATP